MIVTQNPLSVLSVYLGFCLNKIHSHLSIIKQQMKTKSYLEIKVPISFDAPWFCELREALKEIPVRWQRNYYHITMAFINDTQHLSEVESIMHKYLDKARYRYHI